MTDHNEDVELNKETAEDMQETVAAQVAGDGQVVLEPIMLGEGDISAYTVRAKLSDDQKELRLFFEHVEPTNTGTTPLWSTEEELASDAERADIEAAVTKGLNASYANVEGLEEDFDFLSSITDNIVSYRDIFVN